MVKEGTAKLYNNYIQQDDTRWVFGNSILYQMCRDNPKHDDMDVIVGKLWIVGRTYAAAIERRKNGINIKGDFYYEVVAPRMLGIGKELDQRIESLKRSEGQIADDVDNILSTHKFLQDFFGEITGLEKRSLASKYLHFHCPEKFFIYDSRARTALTKLVKKPDKQLLDTIGVYDAEYADFVCRMLELQQYLLNYNSTYETPRALDSFLLYGVT